MEIRAKLGRLRHTEYFWLCIIVAATLALHISTIADPPELVLDEQHYIPDARSIIESRTTLRPEHPPASKLLLVSSMLIFGDNPVGWRAFPVLFGTLNIILFYLICRRLHMSQRAANIATFLIGFENLSFVHASVAMLDVFCVTFMLASFWLYLRKSYSFSAVALALSALAKLPGVFGAGAIGFHWLIINRNKIMAGNRRLIYDFVSSYLISPLAFLILMFFMDFLTSGKWISPAFRINEMMSLMSTLTFSTAKHDSMSRPWEWLIMPKIMPYWYAPSYMGAISFTLWALIIPSVVYMGYRMWRGNNAATFGMMWFFFTYLTWIPMSLLTDRISFVFYFYPTIGAVCIGLGLGMSKLLEVARNKTNAWRWLIPGTVGTFMLAHLVVLGIISPVFT